MSKSLYHSKNKSNRGSGNSIGGYGNTIKNQKKEKNNNTRKKNKNNKNDNSKRDKSKIKHAYNTYGSTPEWCVSLKAFQAHFHVFDSERPKNVDLKKFSKFLRKIPKYQHRRKSVAVFNGHVYYGYCFGDDYNNISVEMNKVEDAAGIAEQHYRNALEQFKERLQNRRQAQIFQDNKQKYEQQKQDSYAKTRKDNNNNRQSRRALNKNNRNMTAQSITEQREFGTKINKSKSDVKIEECYEMMQQQQQRQQQRQQWKDKQLQNMKDIDNEILRYENEIELYEQEQRQFENKISFSPFRDKERIPSKSQRKSPYVNLSKQGVGSQMGLGGDGGRNTDTNTNTNTTTNIHLLLLEIVHLNEEKDKIKRKNKQERTYASGNTYSRNSSMVSNSYGVGDSVGVGVGVVKAKSSRYDNDGYSNTRRLQQVKFKREQERNKKRAEKERKKQNRQVAVSNELVKMSSEMNNGIHGVQGWFEKEKEKTVPRCLGCRKLNVTVCKECYPKLQKILGQGMNQPKDNMNRFDEISKSTIGSGLTRMHESMERSSNHNYPKQHRSRFVSERENSNSDYDGNSNFSNFTNFSNYNTQQQHDKYNQDAENENEMISKEFDYDAYASSGGGRRGKSSRGNLAKMNNSNDHGDEIDDKDEYGGQDGYDGYDGYDDDDDDDDEDDEEYGDYDDYNNDYDYDDYGRYSHGAPETQRNKNLPKNKNSNYNIRESNGGYFNSLDRFDNNK